MKKEKKQLFKTESFALASYLVAKNQKLDELEPLASDSGKFLFCFANSENLQKLVKKFFSFKGQVIAQSLFAAQKSLRSFIHQKKYRNE